MKLKHIKLAGFKSFVDLTTIPFNSQLVAVLGPNGCGKSNVIDAVRWVLGESSAKHLRGESMQDVIFNGSDQRKPVGQAFVELLFDNSDASLGGEYAKYAEIAVKRQITRDGQSQYYINNTRCRRSDVVDIFLGTGLGPRSYAVIEQGMISRFIEAKPEELRLIIEEAAGISKYKERRKETESRMEDTRGNLQRLLDISEEHAKQLTHLEKQAQTAEAYKVLKQDERSTKAHLIALRWAQLEEEIKKNRQKITEFEVTLEEQQAKRQSIDTQLETLQLQKTEATDTYHQIQEQYYRMGNEISRTEDALKYHREQVDKLQQAIHLFEQESVQLKQTATTDETQLQQMIQALEALIPEQTEQTSALETAKQDLTQARQARDHWQGQWDAFQRESSNASEQARLSQLRVQHLEENHQRLTRRLIELNKEKTEQNFSDYETSIHTLQADIQTLESNCHTQQQALAQAGELIQQQRVGNQHVSSELDSHRTQLQKLRGKLSSLEALQAAALNQSNQNVLQVLKQQQLDAAPRLASRLTVAPGFENLVEMVLMPYLQNICLENFERDWSFLQNLKTGALNFFTQDTAAAPYETNDSNCLLYHVKTDLSFIQHLLSTVYMADNLAMARDTLSHLEASASVVTRDGLWISRHWIKVFRDDKPENHILFRKREIEQCLAEIEGLKHAIDTLEQQLQAGQQALSEREKMREQVQITLSAEQVKKAEKQTQLKIKSNQLEQEKNRHAKMEAEIQDSEKQIQQHEANIHQVRKDWEAQLDAMNACTQTREQLLSEKEVVFRRVDIATETHKKLTEQTHQLALEIQALRVKRDGLEQQQKRLTQQIQQVQQKKQEAVLELEKTQAPIEGMSAQLTQWVSEHVTVEATLHASKSRVDGIEHEMNLQNQQRHQIEKTLQEKQLLLEKLRLNVETASVRQNTLEEQIQETQYQIIDILQDAAEKLPITEYEKNLQSLQKSIEALGPINLAAIEEHATQLERKTYLDAQLADLNEALATLEEAIRKIDKETRERFKQTFDEVNHHFKQLFPKLFGGGSSELTLTGEDLLDTGISMMARPPGKRNASVHLLSGGEKALTAIALVFSIFQLNPAPFCLLDEVDAPLDDANVSRFCHMVKDMSKTVQFIYITHNKLTMEMAETLIGVTMHEPGVSRLVSVNMAEALAMAEA